MQLAFFDDPLVWFVGIFNPMAFLRNNRTYPWTESLSVVVSVRGNGIFAAETKLLKPFH